MWLLAFCHVIPYIFFGCQFRFYVKTLTWGFVFNKCTIILATFDFYFVFSNVIISLFIDITIFIKLGLQAKKAGTFNVIGKNSKLPTQIIEVGGGTLRNYKKEPRTSIDANCVYNNRIRFFLQSSTKNVLIAFELISFHILSRRNIDIIWAVCHSLGGVILFAFNREVRKGLYWPFSGCK